MVVSGGYFEQGHDGVFLPIFSKVRYGMGIEREGDVQHHIFLLLYIVSEGRQRVHKKLLAPYSFDYRRTETVS